jgi:alpha-galactosidase/6-phospho-beta-glucosidase family protein
MSVQIRALVEDLIATHADWLPRWITEEKAD